MQSPKYKPPPSEEAAAQDQVTKETKMPNNVVSYINCDISILEIIRKPLGFVAKYHSDVEETWIEAKMSISDQQYK